MSWCIVGQPYRGGNANGVTVSAAPRDPELVVVAVHVGNLTSEVALTPEQAVLVARQLLDASLLAQDELANAEKAQNGGAG